MPVQTTISPIDNKPCTELDLLSADELDTAIAASVAAQKAWRRTTLKERIDICQRFLTEFEKLKDEIVPELTKEMGRPIRYTASEVSSTLDRARHLISIADSSLASVPVEEKAGFRRYLKKEALGVVAVVSPWNYPYMCLINSIVPGLLAGNSLLLKPSPQTPSPAIRLAAAFEAAGLPKNVLQVLHLESSDTLRLAADGRVAFVAFTGSVAGGKGIDRAAAEGSGFKGVGLELGGKDPAYVRGDVDVAWAADNLVDGAMFNSGQSCCGIERIYVDASIYDDFVAKFTEITNNYVLGDPREETTTLGPVISIQSAKRIRAQVADAVKAGARTLIDESKFKVAKEGSAYVAPQVLVDVDHSMDIMSEESFGPVVGIMKVSSDEEALKLMNDSKYGLTASVWTDAKNPASVKAFERLADNIEAGTVFLNRCDFLDPALAWTGVKDSGRGVSLSSFGFDQLTRLKSVHMKL